MYVCMYVCMYINSVLSTHMPLWCLMVLTNLVPLLELLVTYVCFPHTIVTI